MERTDPQSPFTCMGIDCFGPFEVKEGRGYLKRYGLLFTFLLSKAIHIEVLDNLLTGVSLNNLQCFQAIRGHDRRLQCDQGTNFIIAAIELSKNLQSTTCSDLKELLAKQYCGFVLTVPTPPTWEGSGRGRSVRSKMSWQDWYYLVPASTSHQFIQSSTR